MGNPELEAIRQRQMQEMMAQHGMASHHNPGQQKAQEAAEGEADGRRQLMLSQILSVQARERSSDLLGTAKRGPKDDVRLKVHADKTFCAATCVDEVEKLIVSGVEDATSSLHQEQSNNASCYCHGVKMQEKLHTVKRQTRQWAAWTRQEEENFFLALRQVGKNFEKITCRVQSKNRDQVRHYYYRLVRRINKLLAPGFCLDAKNSKDTIAAMLRWWSLLEKFSCSASKLHLKPRRLKIFREALELQLLKDRNKGRKKHLSQGANLPSVPLAMIFNRTSENGSCSVKLLQVDSHNSQKIRATKAATLKRNTATNSDFASSQKSVRKNRRTVSIGESAAYRRWEKAAIAGVSLVADAAEQLEHAHHDRNTSSNQKISVVCSGEKDANNAGDDECPVPYLMLRGASSHQSRETATHSSAKLKLQLFPIDEVTRRALEKDAQNPHLELILSARKRISSVVEHLNRKWGKSTIASGELVLLPYVVHQNDLANSHRWTIKDTVASAADVYATIGSPTIFRLRYGWFPIASPGSGVQVRSLALQPEKRIQVVDIHQIYASNAVPVSKSTEGDDSDPSEVRCTSPKLEPINCHLVADSRIGLPNVSHQSLCSRCEREDGDEKEVDPGMRNEETFTAMEWADSLMSVGDLLSEASKAANSAGTSLTANIQQLQFSNDSFDAAIAAHITGHCSTRLPTQLPLSSIWHAEETCDGFSTQLASVARKEHSNPLTTSNGDGRENTCTKSMDFRDYLKDLTVPSTVNELSIEDIKCGSKSHGDMPSDGRMHDFPTESVKQMFSDAKDPSLTDIFWPDSLEPVVLEMPSSKYHSQDIIIEESAPLGGLSHQIISSLDGF